MFGLRRLITPLLGIGPYVYVCLCTVVYDEGRTARKGSSLQWLHGHVSSTYFVGLTDKRQSLGPAYRIVNHRKIYTKLTTNAWG